MTAIRVLPCVDSDEMAAARKRELSLDRAKAVELGKTAVIATREGRYFTQQGRELVWHGAVVAACSATKSLPPNAPLPDPPTVVVGEMRLQVRNETTLGASRRLVDAGKKPLALNFANGLHPGGGFLTGALAQEEVLCRSSALFATLVEDRMYEVHRERPLPDSSDWAIYSPWTPVFRTDAGEELDEPWLLDFLTCAAPYAPELGQPLAGDILKKRICRVLSIARAYGHTELVLGAWGCGVFRNDPIRTAGDFWDALTGEFSGCFRDVVFAIADWFTERRFLAPFRECFQQRASDDSAI